MIRSVFLLALVCVFPTIAAALSPEDQAARDVAVQWLQLVDSGDYEHAVLQSPEQIGLQQNWMSYLLARRKPMGRVTKRQVVELQHRPTVHGARVWWKYKVVRLKTSFENKLVAMEEVVLTKMSCCWEVFGYTILSEPSGRSKWKEAREHAGAFSESEPDGH